MKYHWPLVLMGGTLLILGAAMPWFQWSGGMPAPWQAASGYDTGFEGVGILPAVGGGVLVLIALLEKGEPGSPSVALMISVLCGLLIVGAGCLLAGPTTPICGDCVSYSPAFGFGVSLIGAMMAVIGSTMRVSGNLSMDEPDVAIFLALEICIICAGLALATRPVLGDWLGLWQTSAPQCYCLSRVDLTSTPRACEKIMAECYTTATAHAIQLTPPAWWP